MSFDDQLAQHRLEELSQHAYSLTASGAIRQRFTARLDRRPDAPVGDFTEIARALEREGYGVVWNERSGVVVVELRARSASRVPWTHVILFILTVVTVFFFPQYNRAQFMNALAGKMTLDFSEWIITPSVWDIGWGAEFTFWLLAIILAHEFGHYVAGRRRNIRLTLPYFIPAPTLFGTMGAVIRFQSPISNRRDLLEVGAAGPLAGFVISVVAVVVGLLRTDPTTPGLFSFQGESILMTGLGRFILGAEFMRGTMDLSPAALAGWAGFLVTALNMIPISQLDGGHVMYGLFQSWSRRVVYVSLVGLFLAGFVSEIWWLYGFIGVAFGAFHPPTQQDEIHPTRTAAVMGWAALIVFALCLNLRPIG